MARAAASYRSARRNAARADHSLAGWHQAGHALTAYRYAVGDRKGEIKALPRVATAAVQAGKGFLARGAKKLASRPWLKSTWGSFFKLSNRKASQRQARARGG